MIKIEVFFSSNSQNDDFFLLNSTWYIIHRHTSYFILQMLLIHLQFIICDEFWVRIQMFMFVILKIACIYQNGISEINWPNYYQDFAIESKFSNRKWIVMETWVLLSFVQWQKNVYLLSRSRFDTDVKLRNHISWLWFFSMTIIETEWVKLIFFLHQFILNECKKTDSNSSARRYKSNLIHK